MLIVSAVRNAALLLGCAIAAAVPAGADDYSSLLRGPQCEPFERGPDAAPAWARPRSMTVVVDSVLLGGAPALRSARPCWRVRAIGRPALMLDAAARELRRRRRVARVAVIGLGYNSLWGRRRHDYGRWARKFDGEAEELLRVLRARGARQFVWVTLREPAAGQNEYAWYFPYVNERLRRLDHERDDLVLADWSAASRRSGLTYDGIHLTRRGARRMARTIRRAISREAARRRGPSAPTTR